MKQTLFFAACAVASALVPAASVFAQAPAFPDVPANHWAAPSVNALAKAGIVNGFGASPLAVGAPQKGAKKATYDGTKPVTRYELAATLYRFVQYMDSVSKKPKSKTGAMAVPKTGADTVKMLVTGGYLNARSAFVKNATTGGAKSVTADELAQALGDVMTKVQETRTPVTTDSGLDIERPGGDHVH